MPTESALKDEVTKDRKVKGGPSQRRNLSRRMEAWANVAGRDVGRLGWRSGRSLRTRLRSLALQVMRATGRFLWAWPAKICILGQLL